jgi:hypothetical protein
MPIYAFSVPSKTTRSQNRSRNLARPLIMPQDHQQPGPEAAPYALQLVGGSHPWVRRIAAGGATTLMVPAGSGLAWLIAGKPDVRLLLGVAAVIAVVTMILGAVAMMYQARQETRRKEIERGAADTLAAALARCLDDAHASVEDLPTNRQVEEAARVRASASQIVSDMTPAILTLLGQPPDQSCSTSQASHERPC